LPQRSEGKYVGRMRWLGDNLTDIFFTAGTGQSLSVMGDAPPSCDLEQYTRSNEQRAE